MTKILTSDLKEKYDQDGFVILKNVISSSKVSQLLEQVYKLYCKFSNDYSQFTESKEPWNDQLFHTKMFNLRKNDPQAFGAIFDSLGTSLTLHQLVTDDSLIEFVAKFLNTQANELSTSEPVVRLDTPFDTRNALEWHQERSYFPQNRDGMRGLVCSIPLHDVTLEMGPLQVCPKSHTEGLITVKSQDKKDLSHGTQFIVPEEITKCYEPISLPLNAGDAVMFNMLLFHRSGKNISNKIRFTAVGRFHIATADDFIPFDLVNHYNSYVKKEILEKKHDCSDIPNNIKQPPVTIN